MAKGWITLLAMAVILGPSTVCNGFIPTLLIGSIVLSVGCVIGGCLLCLERMGKL